MSIKSQLDKIAEFNALSGNRLESAIVAAIESTVRRALKLKKKDPLKYRGLRIKCIGSKAWRYANWEKNPQASIA
jgi:hypothetical protein